MNTKKEYTISIPVPTENLKIEYTIKPLDDKNSLEYTEMLTQHPDFLKNDNDDNNLEKQAKFYYQNVNYIMELLLNDLIIALNDNRLSKPEAKYIKAMLKNTHYTAYEPTRTLQAFKKLCKLSVDQFLAVFNFYISYLAAVNEKTAGITEKFKKERQVLESQNISTEQRDQGLTKLAEEEEKEITELKIKIYSEFFEINESI